MSNRSDKIFVKNFEAMAKIISLGGYKKECYLENLPFQINCEMKTAKH